MPDDNVAVLEEPAPSVWRVGAIDSAEISCFYQDGLTGGTIVVLKTGDQFVVRPGFVDFNNLYARDRASAIIRSPYPIRSALRPKRK